jgi:ribosomal protein S17E
MSGWLLAAGTIASDNVKSSAKFSHADVDTKTADDVKPPELRADLAEAASVVFDAAGDKHEATHVAQSAAAEATDDAKEEDAGKAKAKVAGMATAASQAAEDAGTDAEAAAQAADQAAAEEAITQAAAEDRCHMLPRKLENNANVLRGELLKDLQSCLHVVKRVGEELDERYDEHNVAIRKYTQSFKDNFDHLNDVINDLVEHFDKEMTAGHDPMMKRIAADSKDVIRIVDDEWPQDESSDADAAASEATGSEDERDEQTKKVSLDESDSETASSDGSSSEARDSSSTANDT